MRKTTRTSAPRWRGTGALALCLAAACGDQTAALPGELVWEPCSLDSDGSGPDAECVRVAVPAHWEDPSAGAIELFVKRHGGGGTQLWLLNGGPGASGADFEPMAELFVGEEPTLQVYLLDHRGTGRSSRLGCDAEEDTSPGAFAILEEEWADCLAQVEAQWSTLLGGFTTTNAARDLGWLIDQTREPGREVIVWGGSYGTRWAQRYLQVYPDQADGVSLSGIASPETSFSEYDARYDVVGRAFLASCAEDESCAAKLGDDPVGVADQVMENLDTRCPASGLDRSELRRFFALLLISYWDERTLIPAVLYRLDRCDPGDVAALQYLDHVLNQPAQPSLYERLHSPVLGTHIGLSEFFAGAPTVAEAQAVVDGTIFSLAVGPRYAMRYDTWPRYPLDRFAGGFADSPVPMLLLQGEYDPATPLAFALAVRDAFDGPGQHFFEFPNAPHTFHSPTAAGYECHLVMLYRWVLDPTAPPFDCVAQILPQDFAGNPDLAAYFNTTDVWENTDAVAGIPATPRRLDAVRRDYQNSARDLMPGAPSRASTSWNERPSSLLR